jgi:hypothetical protein
LIFRWTSVTTGVSVLIKLGYVFRINHTIFSFWWVYFLDKNFLSIRWVFRIIRNCWHYCNWLVAYPSLFILLIFKTKILLNFYLTIYRIFRMYSFLQIRVTCVLFSIRIRFTDRLFRSLCFDCIFCLTGRVIYICWC